MSIFQDIIEEQIESQLKEILKDFVKEEDFFHDPWRGSKVFDFIKCIKRVVEIAKKNT